VGYHHHAHTQSWKEYKNVFIFLLFTLHRAQWLVSTKHGKWADNVTLLCSTFHSFFGVLMGKTPVENSTKILVYGFLSNWQPYFQPTNCVNSYKKSKYPNFPPKNLYLLKSLNNSLSITKKWTLHIIFLQSYKPSKTYAQRDIIE